MTDYRFEPQSPGPQHPQQAQTDDTDPTAVMGRRTVAWMVDIVLFLAVVIGTFAASAEYVEIPEGIGLDACDILQERDGDAAAGCFVIQDRAYITDESETAAQTAVSFGYFAFFVIFQGVTGGSPGKLVTGLRVVDADGKRAGVGKSLVRTLLWIVDAAPWFLPLVGFIVGLTSTGHRRVGDLVAKTYVIKAGARGRPVLAHQAAVTPDQHWGAPPPTAWQSTDGPPSAPPIAQPDISGVPADTPAPPPLPASTPAGWDAPPAEAAPPSAPDVDAPGDAHTPVDESTPDIGPDPDWWQGPEADPPSYPVTDPATHDATDPYEAPEPITWDQPSTDVEQPADWAPPMTPNADFGTTDDASPTAGPTPFVAPGTDPRAEAPVAPEPPAPPPPQWDPARNTYIQWDPAGQAWLQWDTNANRWKPIDS